jgi:hypothetical protein
MFPQTMSGAIIDASVVLGFDGYWRVHHPTVDDNYVDSVAEGFVFSVWWRRFGVFDSALFQLSLKNHVLA